MSKKLKELLLFLGVLGFLFIAGYEVGQDGAFEEFALACADNGEVDRLVGHNHLFVQCKQVHKELEWVEK